VTVKIDMPGSSDGVDVQGDARRAIDYSRYRDSLKRYGTAIRSGDAITITLVKVKKDLIEFQLAAAATAPSATTPARRSISPTRRRPSARGSSRSS